MGKLEYSAGLVSKLLWFNEFKKTIQIQNETLDCNKTKKIIFEQNIYQINNIERSTRIYNYCMKRLHLMDQDLVEIFLNSDTSDQKIITLVITMKTEKILFDFVYDMYREKIILGDYEINEKDLLSFINYKSTQSEEIDNWSDSTKYKITQTMLKMLVEAGLVKQNVRERTIEIPLMSNQLENYLKNNMPVYYKALIGVN